MSETLVTRMTEWNTITRPADNRLRLLSRLLKGEEEEDNGKTR